MTRPGHPGLGGVGGVGGLGGVGGPVALAGLLLVAGCASTVQQRTTATVGGAGAASGTGAAGGAAGLGSSTDAGALSGGTGGSLGGGSVSQVRSAGSAGGTGSTTGSNGSAAGGSGGSGGAAGTGATGPGVTATTIAIGIPYAVNSQAAAAALGASGAGVGGGSDQAQWTLILNDINSHGGVLGRKLVPVFHPVDSTSTASVSAQEESACQDYTVDHKVFAVAEAEGDPSQTLRSCLSSAGVAQFYEDLTTSDAQVFSRFPYYFEGGTLRQDRVAALWPALLNQDSYFTPWDTTSGKPGSLPVKVGIVSFDDPATQRAVSGHLEPALAAMGHPAADWRRIAYPQSEADNGTAISSIQAAELAFASEGITHVLPFDAQGAGVGGFFATDAHSQRYYPRFGLNSGLGASTLNASGLWPADELAGAVGYGWVPLLDLAFGDNPDSGPYSSPARQACVRLMKAGGQDMSNAITERQAIGHCDVAHLLVAGLTAGGTPERTALLRGINGLGSSFADALTFATRFDASHHDGVAGVRLLAYLASCSCFRYTSDVLPVS